MKERKEDMARDGYVYVLSLGDGCEYVGSTEDPEHRLNVHRNGRSTVEWVELHGFEGVQTIMEAESPKELEKAVTLLRMREIGWENVRGGPWCQVDLENPPRPLR